MSISGFFKLVEIQTKVASVIPFTVGTLYALYHFGSFKPVNFIIMFISLISFDMATTAINNYYDYKRAKKTHGYNYESHNAIVSHNMKESTVMFVITSLLVIAALAGIVLFLNTSPLILLLGAMSFGVGILYSFGPVPISRTPLGELFSGLFMGFVIVFISVFVHVYDTGIIGLSYVNGILGFSLDLPETAYIFLLSIPTINGIANIMLANNICDIEDDIENRRYTLPIYIGRERALLVYKTLYYTCYADILLLALLGIAPWATLITLLTLIPVSRNIRSFYKLQTKKDTFILSVKNFLIMNVVQILAIGGAVLAERLFG